MAHVHQRTVQHHIASGEDAATEFESERQTARNVISTILNVMEVVLLFRFVFKLLAANPNAAFTSFLYNLTDPLVAPLNGVFLTRAQNGSIFELSTLVAMLVYALVAYSIVHLFGLHRPAASRSTLERTDVVDDDDLP